MGGRVRGTRSSCLVVLVLVVGASGPVARAGEASSAPAPPRLRAAPFSLERVPPPAAGVRHLLVHPGRVPEERLLAGGALVLQRPLPDGWWTARVDGPLPAAVLEEAGIDGLHAFPPQAKLSSTLAAGEPLPWSRAGEGRADVLVHLHEDVTPGEGRAALRRAGAEELGWLPPLHALAARLEPARARLLAAEDAVLRVEEVPAPLEGANDLNRVSSRAEEVQRAPELLTGAGVRVLLYDTGPVHPGHPDFSGRLLLGEVNGPALHATHVAGTLAGDGRNSAGLFRGMAPGAFLISYAYEACVPVCLYNSPLDLFSNFRDALHLHGADLASASLGANVAQNGYPCSWNGDYEATCALLDGLGTGSAGVPILPVWSAGNERGPMRCGTGYGTMGVPGTAKNVVSVGAINGDDDTIAYFSSFGPCDDGRLKPDLVAPGCEAGPGIGVTSAFPGGGYGVMCGTSMATPTVAGVAALVLERGRRAAPGRSLRPETLKAILLGTARDLGLPGPDFRFGYGCVDAAAATGAAGRGQFLEGEVLHGGTAAHPLWIAPGTARLQVTLVWSDPPASPGASIALVNDLDLELRHPGGGVVLPWSPDPEAPDAPAAPRRDGRNNVEQAAAAAPLPGMWVALVRGTAVPLGPQRYALSWSGPSGALRAAGLPAPGREVELRLRAPGSAALRYALGLSLASTPGIPHAGRVIPLAPDALFFASQSGAPGLRGFRGTLDSLGEGTGAVRLPGAPRLAGTTFYAAFAVEDPAAPGGLGFVSEALGLTVRMEP